MCIYLCVYIYIYFPRVFINKLSSFVSNNSVTILVDFKDEMLNNGV